MSSDAAKRFVVINSTQGLTVMHWGRPVNYIGGSGFPGRQKGYHQDLEKMLILSSSDKPGEGVTTGKFGLGFKSVFLVSNAPTLLSGRLNVEILGGVYPRKLDAYGELKKLDNSETSRGNRITATFVHMPYDRATPEEMSFIFRTNGRGFNGFCKKNPKN